MVVENILFVRCGTGLNLSKTTCACCLYNEIPGKNLSRCFECICLLITRVNTLTYNCTVSMADKDTTGVVVGREREREGEEGERKRKRVRAGVSLSMTSASSTASAITTSFHQQLQRPNWFFSKYHPYCIECAQGLGSDSTLRRRHV